MVKARYYKQLHDRVVARPGAVERLAGLRQETLAEIGLYEMRRQLDCSQSELAAALGISQAAVSQLENAQDPTLSRLQKYLEPFGATVRIHAVFENGERGIQHPHPPRT